MGRNEAAKELRVAYKAKGWNSRMIGVRAKPCTYSGSIDVTIKDVSVPYATAKEMAESYERIRRCEASGEILSGGNLYVSVNESDERKAVLSRRYADAVDTAIEKLNGKAGPIEPINNEVGIGYDSQNDQLRLWPLKDGGQIVRWTFYNDEGSRKAIALCVAHTDTDQQ